VPVKSRPKNLGPHLGSAFGACISNISFVAHSVPKARFSRAGVSSRDEMVTDRGAAVNGDASGRTPKNETFNGLEKVAFQSENKTGTLDRDETRQQHRNASFSVFLRRNIFGVARAAVAVCPCDKNRRSTCTFVGGCDGRVLPRVPDGGRGPGPGGGATKRPPPRWRRSSRRSQSSRAPSPLGAGSDARPRRRRAAPEKGGRSFSAR